MSATDIDNRPHTGEVVGLHNSLRDPATEVTHGGVEQCALARVCREILEEFRAHDVFQGRLAGLNAVQRFRELRRFVARRARK